MSETGNHPKPPAPKILKGVMLLLAFLGVYFAGSMILQNWVIMPSFFTLEQEEAQKNLVRCQEAIANEILHLDLFCADWTVWDDTYQFVQGKNEAYIKANLDWSTLESNSNINLIVFCKSEGGVIWGEAYDSTQGGNIRVSEFQPDKMTKDNYLLSCKTVDCKMTGIIRTSNGPMLVSARPVLTTKGQGPIHAIAIMGRFLNTKALVAIANQTKVPFTTTDLCKASPTPHEERILAQLAREPFIAEPINQNELHGYGVVTDLQGKPVLLLKTIFSREIMKRGQATARLASWFFGGIIIIILIAAWIALRLAHAQTLVETRTLELKDSEKRMELAVQGADLGTWDWNLSTGYLSFNKRWASMLGYTLSEIPPNQEILKKMIHPDDISNVEAALNAHLGGQTDFYETEHRIQHKAGHWIWVLAKGRVIGRNAQGKPQRICGTYLDITERRQIEEERLALERQMLHAQKLESLGVLAGGIAHDFNNLLMGVLGYASLALQDIPPTHPAAPSLHEIDRAARKAAELAQKMLSYSGRGCFVLEPVNLSALLEEMATLLRTTIPNTITLHVNLSQNLPPIEADAAQMQQVIMNLFTNAAEAIGDTPGHIDLATGHIACTEAYLANSLVLPLSTDNKPQPGHYVFLEAKDTGAGMNDEIKARLFEPFFTTKFTGRGLGMAAVLGIVRGHQGAIMLDTHAGQGTTIRILFPLSSRQVNEIPVSAHSTTSPPGAGHGSILVIDDEDIVRDLLKEVLERQGFNVLVANDGNEGVQRFRENAETIDCVLLDLTMPHMDGEMCLDALRQIKRDIRVILTSGYSEQDVGQRFADKGLAGFIQKPYQTSALQEILQQVLG